MQIDVAGMTANGIPRTARGADELLEQSWRRSLEQALLAHQDRSGFREGLGSPSESAAATGAEPALQRKVVLEESGVAGSALHAVRDQAMVKALGQSVDSGKGKWSDPCASSEIDRGPGGGAAEEAPSARHVNGWPFANPQTPADRAGRSQAVASEERSQGNRLELPRASSPVSKAHLFVEHTREGLVLWVRDKHSASAALDVAVSALMQDARARGLRFSAVHLNGRPYETDVRNDELPDPGGKAGHPSEPPTLAEGPATNFSAKEA